MSLNDDYTFALEMQRRLNAEAGEGDSDIEEIDFKKPSTNLVVSKKPLQIKRSNPHSNLDEEFLNRTQNLVHPQWETLDPTPDIFALFSQFDTKFFQSRLKCVTLEWSKRMYSCAGICYSRRNRYGMDVTIRLSQPLLILRPRKDLVETMLHEMIHAYCFVLNIREGNGGHGPNFKKIMNAINKVAGTNITVYHTFHDEVELYKQHWWRCNGVCQDRSPFFGYVKRTSNRAPGPNDQWWASHVQNCGGTFMKIKEPEKKKKSKATKDKENKNKTSVSDVNDLRKFFTPISKNPTGSNVKSFNDFNSGFKGPSKTNGGGTLLLNPKTKTSTNTNNTTKPPSSIAKAFPPSSYPGLSKDPFNVSTEHTPPASIRSSSIAAGAAIGNLHNNVVGLRDLGGLGSGNSNGNIGRPISGTSLKTASRDNWGQGSLLTSSFSTNNTPLSPDHGGGVDRQHLRKVWSKRFDNKEGKSDLSNGLGNKRSDSNKTQGDSKRRRISTETQNFSDIEYVADENSANNKKDWIVVDDDIMLQEQTDMVITLSSDEDDDGESSDSETITKPKINRNMTLDQRQTMIKKEIMDESIDLCDDDIELIDDEYDDNEGRNLDLTVASELADTSVIDEFFGEDTMMKEFKKENDCLPSSSRYTFDERNDIITCPICLEKMTRTVLADHLNGCTGIAVKILPPKKTMKKLSTMSKEARPKKQTRPSRKSTADILRNAGYSEDILEQIASASSMEEDEEELEFLRSAGIKRSPNSTKSNTTRVDLNSSSEDENSRLYRQRNIYKTTRQCPVCAREVEETEMNEHLDECLKK